MKRIALVLLVAACGRDQTSVPDAYRAMVPTEHLFHLDQHDADPKNVFYGGTAGVSALYDHTDAATEQRAFADRVGALAGYQLISSCGDDGGFEVIAATGRGGFVVVDGERRGEDVVVAQLSVLGEGGAVGLADGCDWLPAAQAMCDLTDPRRCEPRS